MINNELKTLLEDYGVTFENVLYDEHGHEKETNFYTCFYYQDEFFEDLDEVIERLLEDEPELEEQIAELTAEDEEAKERLKEFIQGDYMLIFDVDRVADGIRKVKAYLVKEGLLFLDITHIVIKAFRLDSTFNNDEIILKGWGYSASYHIANLLESAGIDVNLRSVYEI